MGDLSVSNFTSSEPVCEINYCSPEYSLPYDTGDGFYPAQRVIARVQDAYRFARLGNTSDTERALEGARRWAQLGGITFDEGEGREILHEARRNVLVRFMEGAALYAEKGEGRGMRSDLDAARANGAEWDLPQDLLWEEMIVASYCEKVSRNMVGALAEVRAALAQEEISKAAAALTEAVAHQENQADICVGGDLAADSAFFADVVGHGFQVADAWAGAIGSEHGTLGGGVLTTEGLEMLMGRIRGYAQRGEISFDTNRANQIRTQGARRRLETLFAAAESEAESGVVYNVEGRLRDAEAYAVEAGLPFDSARAGWILKGGANVFVERWLAGAERALQARGCGNLDHYRLAEMDRVVRTYNVPHDVAHVERIRTAAAGCKFVEVSWTVGTLPGGLRFAQ